MSIKEVADKIGTGVRVVRNAEQGKPTTSVVIYMALLWAYDLLQAVDDLANPLRDEVGLRLIEAKKPKRSQLEILHLFFRRRLYMFEQNRRILHPKLYEYRFRIWHKA